MMNKLNVIRNLKNQIGFVFVTVSLIACGSASDNNLPGVPTMGLFAAVGINQHSGENNTQVAAAIFLDGKPIDLVGGDVIQASTSTDTVLLLDRGVIKGSYSANLLNTSNLNQVDLLIVHKPLEARKGRWYPVDILNSDPGPGELVGSAASIMLPPEPSLIAPAAGSVYNSINDSFTVNWTAVAAGDIMKIHSAMTCKDAVNTETYATEIKLLDESDDGTETVKMNQLIYDINDSNSGFQFIKGQARIMLFTLLEKLSNGAIKDSSLASINPVNPISSNCEIRLILFRFRAGSFASTSTNGTIYGSRSADVTIQYKSIN